jgi:hypothetical protein
MVQQTNPTNNSNYTRPDPVANPIVPVFAGIYWVTDDATGELISAATMPAISKAAAENEVQTRYVAYSSVSLHWLPISNVLQEVTRIYPNLA